MLRMTFVASIVAIGLCGAGLALRANGEESQGDFARGAKYYSDNCARCHKARAAVEHRPREWAIITQHMRIIAGLPGQQARDVWEFLRRSSIPAPTE